MPSLGDWQPNRPISIYHLGWKQHLFWSQTPPIYPNILQYVLLLDKEKIVCVAVINPIYQVGTYSLSS